jgi:predicted nuclease of predicted toxin-antitoxin system
LKFLADMGVAGRVVEWLRANGHDAVHLREQGLKRLPDSDIFKKAAEEQRIILTFDLDFGEIMALSGTRPTSVIIFRLRNTRTLHVIARLQKVLDTSIVDLVAGTVMVVEETRHRVRHLPLEI